MYLSETVSKITFQKPDKLKETIIASKVSGNDNGFSFNTALNTAKAGLKAVTAPDVLGFYQDLKDPSKEYQRKIRTVIRGMTGLSRHAEVLNFGKFGFFACPTFNN